MLPTFPLPILILSILTIGRISLFVAVIKEA